MTLTKAEEKRMAELKEQLKVVSAKYNHALDTQARFKFGQSETFETKENYRSEFSKLQREYRKLWMKKHGGAK